MRILLIGADGFLGRNLAAELSDHELYGASHVLETEGRNFNIDLSKPDSIAAVLEQSQPEVIVNLAGIVANNETASLNAVFTTNLLDQLLATGTHPKRVIVTGSAAEYGIVKPEELPIPEDAPVRAENFYAKGKAAETAVALKYRKEHKLPVFVARVFNPIGVGMNPRMLIPNVIAQVQACAAGESKSIEISRLDSLRDYIAVRDVALAYKALIEGEPSYDIYNVGSGVATSNSDLINLILDNWGLETRPKLVETADQPEPLAAAQADISRIKHDLKWSPRSTIEQSVKEICDASK